MRKITVSDAYRLFYCEHAPHRSRGTCRVAESHLRCWEGLAGEPDIREITSDTFAKVKTELTGNLKPASINTMIRTITTVLRHCGPPSDGCPHGRGIIPSVPYAGRKIPERKSPKWVPTLDHLSAVYEAATVARWPQTHVSPATFWRSFFVAAFNTGLRRGDLLWLNWDAVDFDDRKIEVVCEKTLKVQQIPINATLESHLKTMYGRGDHGGDDRVFPCSRSNKSFAGELRRIATAAGLSKTITPQAIRRAAGTAYETEQIGAGQILLGHATKNVSFLHYVSALIVLRPVADRLKQPDAFVHDGKPLIEPIQRKPVGRLPAKPEPVTDPGNWEFPASETQFVFQGRSYPMKGRTLALLRLLVESDRVVDRQTIRGTVYEDFPEVTDNTIKGGLIHLRERLRVLFCLPEWFNPVPSQPRAGWFLALPEMETQAAE